MTLTAQQDFMQVQLCPHVEIAELWAHTTPPRGAHTPKVTLVSEKVELGLNFFALRRLLGVDFSVLWLQLTQRRLLHNEK